MDDLPALVDEPGGWRNLPPAEGGDGLGIAVVDARVGNRELLEELLGGAAIVLDVDADEGDLFGVRLGGLREEGELRSAGRTPRAPLIDDRRMALQLRELRLQGLGRSVDDLVRLGAVRGERLGQSLRRDGGRRPIGAPWLVSAALGVVRRRRRAPARPRAAGAPRAGVDSASVWPSEL